MLISKSSCVLLSIDAHLVSHLIVWSSKIPYTWKKMQYLGTDGRSKDV